MLLLLRNNRPELACHIYRLVLALVTFAGMTFSIGATAAPIILDFDSCSEVEIDGQSLRKGLVAANDELPPDELKVFQARRMEILKKVLETGKKHMILMGLPASIKSCFKGKPKSPKALAKESLIKTMTVVDKVIWENARHIANCSQWGACTQFGAHFVIGYKKWTTGIAAYLGIDRIQTYDENSKAYKDYFVELDYPNFAQIPSLDFSANIRFHLHFDNGNKNPNKALELTVYPVAPLAYKGENSIGFGAHTGFGFPPWIGAMAHYKAKTFRVSCADLLRRFFK